MKNLLLAVLASIILVSCHSNIPKLHKGDKFLLEFGYSVDTWTVIGSNSKGYYCKPDWSNDFIIFYENSDFDKDSFKLLTK